jgi:hypothetical protein
VRRRPVVPANGERMPRASPFAASGVVESREVVAWLGSGDGNT